MEFGQAAVCGHNPIRDSLAQATRQRALRPGICVDFRARNTLDCLEIGQCCEGGERILRRGRPGKYGNWQVVAQLTGLPYDPMHHPGDDGMALASRKRWGKGWQQLDRRTAG